MGLAGDLKLMLNWRVCDAESGYKIAYYVSLNMYTQFDPYVWELSALHLMGV